MTNDLFFIKVFLTNSLIFVILIYFALNYCKSYFPTSIASNRSALSHLPTIRGIGILFPICLILSSILLSEIIDIFNTYYLLILLSTLIGFYDDLKNINYKKKLICLTFIFLTVSIFDNKILMFDEINIFFSLVISLFIFIFYILFFNQIDGINGLSSGTFCVFLGALIFFQSMENEVNHIFINILGVMFLYFLLNILNFKFFQGDAGAYFLGATSYLALQDHQRLFFISFILLFPILADIVWTTFIRLYFRYNLSQPHKAHLYQKSVSKIKSHFPVTFCHIILQLTCFLVIYFFEIFKGNIFTQFVFLLLFGAIFSLVYAYSAYSFNKTK